MSEQKISLELLGGRVLTLTAEVRHLQHRLTAMEGHFSALESRITALKVAVTTRFDAMERRFTVQEERMSAMLALIVRIAERLDRAPEPRSGGFPDLRVTRPIEARIVTASALVALPIC
jgi:hypothetical protein